MDFSILSEYFVLVVMVGCLTVGYVIKHSTFFKWIKNDDIPAILAVVGAILNCIEGGFSLNSIVWGATMGLSSTGLHQAYKNFVESGIAQIIKSWLDNKSK